MKKMLIAALFVCGMVAAIEAAPTDVVTQADLQAILQRLTALEKENKAQAARIAELEGQNRQLTAKATAVETKVAATEAKVAAVESTSQTLAKLVPGEGTTTNESGRIWTLPNGSKYYLADTTANIFEPLTESGLRLTPYGYLVFEGVYNSAAVDADWSTDFVKPRSKGSQKTHETTFSVQDSILGFALASPETVSGWTFTGKAEFDFAGGNANAYDFHWRHLYINALHEASGWNVLFGQTWHLWKMVTPQEIDGAWLENTGHPYRRSPQVRISKKWDFDPESSLEWRVGVVKNGPGMGGDRDGDGNQDNSSSCWPLFETALMYDHKAAWEDSDRRWLLGVGGQYGRDKSRRWSGNDADGNREYNGSYDEYNTDMIMFAGKIPFLEKFTLTGQIYAGENLGGVQAGCAQRVYYYELDRKGDTVRTVGGFADLRYDLNDTWAFAGGYGFDNPVDSDVACDGGIEYNERSYIDAFYRVNANLHFGLEYAYLTTDYYNEGTAPDHRVQFSAYFDF